MYYINLYSIMYMIMCTQHAVHEVWRSARKHEARIGGINMTISRAEMMYFKPVSTRVECTRKCNAFSAMRHGYRNFAKDVCFRVFKTQSAFVIHLVKINAARFKKCSCVVKCNNTCKTPHTQNWDVCQIQMSEPNNTRKSYSYAKS